MRFVYLAAVVCLLLAAFFAPSPIQALSPNAINVAYTYGFDTCDAPSLSVMQAWWASSPYRYVGIYYGGSSRACPNQTNLNASWVSQVSAQGWGLLPIWAGPQAPCRTGGGSISYTASTAYNQGFNEADLAIGGAGAYGLASGVIIYYDMEFYDYNNVSCRAAVNSFVSGWTDRLEARGYHSGLYGQGLAAGTWAAMANPPETAWMANWITPAGPYTPPSPAGPFWQNNQIHQYSGDVTESYGGYSIRIDRDYCAGGALVVNRAYAPNCGNIGDPPVGSGSIYAFALGDANVLWQRVSSNGAWAAWQQVGSPANGAISEPGAVVSEANRVDVFIRGGDNGLWQRTAINGAWGAWQGLGGGLSSGPDATSTGAGQFDVIIKGNDNHLYRRAFRNGAWANWEFLSSPNSAGATSDPAIASENGRLVVFVKGSDNALWRRENAGAGWGAWLSMGGGLTSAPDAASYGPGHMDVVVRGSDNTLYHKVYLNGAWSDWAALGAPPSIATTNASIAAAGGRVDVFVRGSDNALWQRTNTGSGWGAWTTLGGGLSSGPDAAAFGTSGGTNPTPTPPTPTPQPPTGPLAVPYIRQYQGLATSNCDCGPASVAMIVKYFGLSGGLSDSALVAQVRQRTGTATTTCNNTGFSHLQTALSQYGLPSSQISSALSPAPDAQVQAMKNATAAGKPVIAFVHGGSLGREDGIPPDYGDHWIVVKGFSSDGQTVYVNDPDDQTPRWTGWIQGGSITLSISTFRTALQAAAPGPYGIIVN